MAMASCQPWSTNIAMEGQSSFQVQNRFLVLDHHLRSTGYPIDAWAAAAAAVVATFSPGHNLAVGAIIAQHMPCRSSALMPQMGRSKTLVKKPSTKKSFWKEECRENNAMW